MKYFLHAYMECISVIEKVKMKQKKTKQIFMEQKNQRKNNKLSP